MENTKIKFTTSDIVDIRVAMNISVASAIVCLRISEKFENQMELVDLPVKKTVVDFVLEKDFFDEENIFDHKTGILIKTPVEGKDTYICNFYEFEADCLGQIMMYVSHPEQSISVCGLAFSLNERISD